MKAITLQQPWASLIARGIKKYETRSWPTKYRGPIAIHAGKQIDPGVLQYLFCPEIRDQLIGCDITLETFEELPRGAVIATADLVNVWRIVYRPGPEINGVRQMLLGESLSADKHFVPSEKEMALGYWIPGNYAWELQNVRILPEPVPAKGKQGLWNWEPEGKDKNK